MYFIARTARAEEGVVKHKNDRSYIYMYVYTDMRSTEGAWLTAKGWSSSDVFVPLCTELV